ncbi:tetratricopeptide repeat protein [Neobacillus ginsengisoli]|uniref:TPR repeat protein n=1 Tax=Neobacillus ginsengisoli TaxID=904295 RepID=A0ABT9XW62_9BACI|nr:tetratricopeptide repeat protein [Neobacillus ginsengisoli]MDQ0199807.1 TPR repeat protein [Neobacillus ginsengisoli]
MKINESEFNRDCNKLLDITSYLVEKEAECPEYLFNVYKRYYESKRYSEALEYLSQSLNKGFPISEFEMGQHYYFGSAQLELPKNHFNAFQCYSIAADLGHAGAQFSLGYMYLKGEGVVSDVKQAILLLDNAANQGLNEALDLLGKIYQHGYYEITPDFKKAERYYKFAVNQDYSPSIFHLALLLENLHRYEEAYELFIHSAKMGVIEAINYNMSTYK